MARRVYQSVARDGNGRIIPSANVTVYLAGGTTLATIYTSESSSADADSVVQAGTDGTFEFWIDESDYFPDQKFKYTISKTGYSTYTRDNVVILNCPARQDWGTAAPTSGTWPIGWKRWNRAPALDGSLGWICTTAGTPGTWAEFGFISAVAE